MDAARESPGLLQVQQMLVAPAVAAGLDVFAE
jgi:hypothetical protein